ncbi:2OG-Fe(II) oxygenase [Rhodococcus sp. NPDC003383]
MFAPISRDKPVATRLPSHAARSRTRLRGTACEVALPQSPMQAPLSGEQLRSAFEPDAPLLHFRGGLNEDYCRDVVTTTRSLSYAPYEKTTNSAEISPIAKFGPTVFDWIGKEFSPYLDETEVSSQRMREVFSHVNVPHPLDVTLKFLRPLWNGDVAVADEAGRPYFAGVLRNIDGGALPHIDHARKETPDLSIGRVVAQASLLYYLEAPSAGGALRVYDKEPSHEDDTQHTLGYGYSPEAIAGVSFTGVTPSTGSLVLFPTTRIHSVDPIGGQGRRVTWSVFLGLAPEGNLLLWS